MPSSRGAAQVAVISPLLANIYLHYVLDLWSHSWRKRRATGDIIIKLSLRRRLHRLIAETDQWLQRVLSGHQNYFGVPCNYGSVNFFFRCVGWYWFRSLRRRSQRHRMTVARFHRIMARYFPAVRVIHPYPAVRFDAKTQGRSPVR